VTGQLRNCRMWVREPGKKNWRERIDFDQIDRDVPLSENLFSTEARPGAKMMNTKETAQLTRAGMASGPRPKQGHRFDAFLSFTLPDGTELVVWTCQDAEQADQTGLFGGLTPGGDLPSLPHTLMSLTTIPPTPGLVYTGRHLAWTKSNGVCYEWAIYVPNGAVPNRRDFLTYSGELRDSASPTKPIRANIGDQDIVIETREDFDRWILDGMAELSDTGERPKGITYESVLQLAATIRLTLPREAQSQATPVQQAR
jgi:hypothetical protein